MSNVSYQTFLADSGLAGAPQFAPLPQDTFTPAKKDADRTLKIRVTKRQEKWLQKIDDITGKGVDTDAVLRTLIDLARQLDIDWAMTASVDALRDEIRDAVRIRHTTTPA
jgi:hypothetical protein